MKARDLMTSPAVTCNVNDSLEVAAKLMWDHDCGAIVAVREDGKVGGVITDRDICMAAFTQGKVLDQILVNSAMAGHVLTARPDTSIGEIENMMAERQIRRIPIVDDNNLPVGLVSLNDLAIESVQPDTRLKNPFAKIAHTVAAICRRRIPKQQAA